jgi:hypothetical protein
VVSGPVPSVTTPAQRQCTSPALLPAFCSPTTTSRLITKHNKVLGDSPRALGVESTRRQLMNTRQASGRTRLALGLGVPLLIATSALAQTTRKYSTALPLELNDSVATSADGVWLVGTRRSTEQAARVAATSSGRRVPASCHRSARSRTSPP